MLIKFETNSNRVKGISFHSTRYWLLASLHSGAIQLWDYNVKTLVDTYEEHEGPVRGICFHKSQPLFASGGDDNKLKVWNFKQKKCLFTLEGHLDYIRTVCFHHELAWLLSSSDDQTIRIWNWQSRSCISILTGHNHYIMSAHFHPSEDMIISSSLDQTVRVWDFKSLKQKYNSGGKSADIMLGTDVVVKFVLEGHDRGVNWASFQNSGQYIVTAADDRSVRLWRYTESKAWEVEVMRGHSNNVSSAIFHPNLEVIISNSEDKSIRIWDMSRRNTIFTYKKDEERFWVLAAHPTLNLVAAGCDSGVVVFKLEKERVPAVIYRGYIYIARNKQLKRVGEDNKEVIIAAIKPPCKKEVYLNNPSYIYVNSFNPTDTNILLQYDQDGGNYLLFTFPKEWKGDHTPACIQGQGLSTCFVGKDRFAVLTKMRELLICDFNNSSKKKITFPVPPSSIFQAGINKILMISDQKLSLFEIGLKEVLKVVEIEEVKHVIWSPNMEYVGIIGKHEVSIFNKDLEFMSKGPRERGNIKSGTWDPCGVLLYSTSTHIKYLLMNGDTGTVCSVEVPLYLVTLQTKSNQKTIVAVDRAGKTVRIEITSIEYRFKLALHNKRFAEVKEILENGGLAGNSIVKYLQDRGFPEIALYFVEDEKAKFNLAIQAGTIETALQCAMKLNDKECWVRLGAEALKQGNSQIVEMAYQKTRNLDRLSVLYLITGNLTKLVKMQQISESRNDKMRLLHNTLLRGDIEKRTEMLAEAGQVPLAYVTARLYNMSHMLNGPLEESLGQEAVDKLEDYISKLPKTTCLQPPCPLITEASSKDLNWPLKNLITSEYELRKNQSDPANPYAMTQIVQQEIHSFADEAPIEGGWGDKLDFELEESEAPAWGSSDFEVPDVPEVADDTNTAAKSAVAGPSQQQRWIRACTVAGELVAAGGFSQAMQLLTRQVGITNFLPLKPLFLSVFMSNQVDLPLLPHLKPLSLQLVNGTKPFVAINLTSLSHQLKEAYKCVTQAKFSEALQILVKILQSILLLSAANETEENEAKELIKICVEYISCMRLELARQEAVKESPAKAMVLAYFMSMCKLQPSHQSLTLRSAITFAYKYKNFITCSSLCKKFLELVGSQPQVLGNDAKQVIDKHRKLLAYCQQVFTNDLALGVELPETSLDIASILCQKSFTVVLTSQPSSRCPYCQSIYHKAHKGSICDICGVGQVGMEVLGLKLL